MENVVDRTITHYQNNGFRSLIRSAPKFVQRQILESIVQKAVQPYYSQIMLDSNELKHRSEVFYELQVSQEDISMKINEEVAPLKGNKDLQHNYSPRYSYTQPFVAMIPDVVVAGPDAVAITDDGKVLADPTDPVPNYSTQGRLAQSIIRTVSSSPFSVGAPLLQGKSPSTKTTEEAVAILHSRWNNYYHWMLEHLLKLQGIEEYERKTGKTVKLIIPPDPSPYVTESLKLMGYDKNEYIEWNQDVLRANNLILPSFPSPRPESIRWMKNRITPDSGTIESTSADKWIYISRQKMNKRKIINYGEFSDLLNKYGIESVACEDISLEEEINLFKNVDGIIGPHGAGLSSIVWGENIQLIEIFNNVIKAPYYVLCYILDHDYTAFSAKPIKGKTNPRNYNIEVNIQEFEALIKNYVGQSNES